MKKFEKIFLAFILFFATIAYVNAKDEVFKYDWEKDQRSQLTYRGIPYNSTIEFKGGYVHTDVTLQSYPSTRIEYYNFKGEKLSSKTLKYNVIYTMTSIDSNVYTIEYGLEENTFSLVKYDENFNEIDSLELPDNLREYFLELIMEAKLMGFNILSNENDEIAFIGPNEDEIYITDKDFKNPTTKELNEDLIKKYYPSLYYGDMIIEEVQDNYTRFISRDLKTDSFITSGARSDCPIAVSENIMPLDLTCNYSGILMLTGLEGNELWTKEFEEYDFIYSAKFVDDYIVAIGNTINNICDFSNDYCSRINSDILIFDMKGNLVQKINGDDSVYQLITPSNDGFTINRTTGTCRDINLNPIIPNDIIDYDCEMHLEAYYLPRNITTNIIGNGTINVVDIAQSGENVTYEIIPEEGYVLGTIKITDKTGNVIEYTSNKFIMPSSDVMIEVTFLPMNPETKDLAIVSIVLMLAIGFGLMFINYKKLKFLS